MILPRMDLPPIARVRQALPADHIADIASEVHRCLGQKGLGEQIIAGQRVAITAGSRGQGSFNDILRATIAEVKARGAEPFLIPAMGSHGGATAEGQLAILKGYGISEQSMGCPIRATMDTVCLGQAENGVEVHFDRYAHEADATIVVGRCKTHPILHEGNGSGLLKMTTIGLGKQTGAQAAHSYGLAESVQQVPKVSLAQGNVILGINVVENGCGQPYHIEAVPTWEFWESDRRCLGISRPFVTRVPFATLDVLVVSYIGKDISGAGMDPNVTGFWRADGEGEHVPNLNASSPWI